MAKNYCRVCQGLIPRGHRSDGRLESITQYNERRTCGAGTPCASQWRSELMRGNQYGRAAIDKPAPSYEDRTPGHPWLYRAGR